MLKNFKNEYKPPPVFNKQLNVNKHLNTKVREIDSRQESWRINFTSDCRYLDKLNYTDLEIEFKALLSSVNESLRLSSAYSHFITKSSKKPYSTQVFLIER